MWTIAVSEWKRLIRMKSVLAMLILAPLVLIFILGSSLNEQYQPKDQSIKPVILGYYDADSGDISKGFQEFLNQMKHQNLFQYYSMSSKDELIKQLDEDKIDLGLYIPPGFNHAILTGQQTNWEVLLGEDQIQNITGKMLLESFIQETNRMQAIAYVVGPHVLALGQGPIEDNTTNTEDASFVKMGRLTKDQSYSAIQYYSATMLVMFLLYAGLMASVSFLREKESHTLTRMQVTPITSFQIILGKLVGNGLLASLQAAVIICVTAFVYGVYWGESILYIILICVITIFASMALALVVAFLSTSTKVLSGVFATFIGIMTFLSGGMSPNDGTMLESVKMFTLNHWASNSFIQLMTSENYTIIHHNLLILGMIGASLLIMASLLYRRVGYYE